MFFMHMHFINSTGLDHAGFRTALELFSKEHLVCFTKVKVRDGVWYRHINNFPEVNYYIRVRVSATLCFTEARVRLKVRVIVYG